jgi:hypothetical protein
VLLCNGEIGALTVVIPGYFRGFRELHRASVGFIVFVCPSVRLFVYPHGTTRLPMNGYLFEAFLKGCRENYIFLKSDDNNG